MLIDMGIGKAELSVGLLNAETDEVAPRLQGVVFTEKKRIVIGEVWAIEVFQFADLGGYFLPGFAMERE